MEKINKETRTLRELVANFNFKPHESIIAQVDLETYPFRGNRFFSFSANKLAFAEYQKCLELMQNRMGDQLRSVNQYNVMNLMFTFQNVMNQISTAESQHLETLEELAIELIKDLYNVPDNIDLKAFLRPNGNMPKPGEGGDEEEEDFGFDNNQEEEEEISPERLEVINREIQKRLILNTLVHGSSIHIWKSSYYIVREQLNILNPQLVGLYDKYSALVSFLMWQFSIQMMQHSIQNNGAMVQGINTVEFAENEKEESNENAVSAADTAEEEDEIDATLTGYAINFPVLLHELSKAVVDYLITNGIPQDFTPAELKLYYEKADRYSDEIWHYFFGPTLWTNLLETVEKTPDELPYIISAMAELEYEELADLCNLIIYDKEKARKRMEVLEII